MSVLQIALLIVVLFVVQGFALAFILGRQPKKPRDEEKDTAGLMLLQRFESLERTLDARMADSTKQMHESVTGQFSQSQQLVRNIEDRVSTQLLEVTRGVAETKESTKQVFTIATQLQNLEKVLMNQKQRGNLGEASLELILSNILPGQYEQQYLFKDGEKVDFIIRTPEGLLPVDAKFPLENYSRLIDEVDEIRREQYSREFKNDVKKRIDETAKYIRPGEGTMPIAFMFIPSESIYYDLLNSEVGTGINSRDLIDYAYNQKNVIIASPTTFLAYLKTVLFGIQRLKVQEAAKDIIKNVADLSKHLKSYEESHNSMGKSLSAAVGHYEKSGSAFKLIDKDVVRITGESAEFDLEIVDKPRLADSA